MAISKFNKHGVHRSETEEVLNEYHFTLLHFSTSQSHISHSYLLKHEDNIICNTSQFAIDQLTIKHL